MKVFLVKIYIKERSYTIKLIDIQTIQIFRKVKKKLYAILEEKKTQKMKRNKKNEYFFEFHSRDFSSNLTCLNRYICERYV